MNGSEIIFIVEESLEGGYEAKALDCPIFTQAESVEDLKSQIKDAVHCHFEDSQTPKIIRLHFVREEIIAA